MGLIDCDFVLIGVFSYFMNLLFIHLNEFHLCVKLYIKYITY